MRVVIFSSGKYSYVWHCLVHIGAKNSSILETASIPTFPMTTLDDTVGYQLPSSPYAQYALQEKTVPTFSRTEIPDTMDTIKNVSDDKYQTSKLIGNVSITDHKGAFVGHVLASTNTSLQVRQQASNRTRIKGFVDAMTSSHSNGLSSSEYAPHVASSSGKKRGIVSTPLCEVQFWCNFESGLS